MKKILITGGCGFIGLSLLNHLKSNYKDCHIRILDNFTVGLPEDLARITSFSFVSQSHLHHSSKGVFLLEGDIRDYKICEIASQDIDCIIHLAANTGVGPSVVDPRLDFDCNVIGTFNLLEAARHHSVSKFIFASSGAPLGEVVPPIHEEIAPHPVSPYGASKLAGEGYCSVYFRTYGLGTVCLRFGNVYGPLSSKKASVVAKFIKQAISGENCSIFGQGQQTRDFIYIDDLVRAILLSIDKPVGGETFQIATGKEQTVAELAFLIKDSLIKRGIEMNIVHEAERLGDVQRNYSDTSKAKSMLEWQATTVLATGIENTVSWFIDKS